MIVCSFRLFAHFFTFVELFWEGRIDARQERAALVNALNIEDLYIVTWSLDEVTGDLITSLSFVIDSPVSQVQQDTSIL